MNESALFAFLKNLGNEFMRSAPAWKAWRRDAALVKSAGIQILLASDAPMAELLSIWKRTDPGPFQMRALAAFPEWLDHPDVRIWLKGWASGGRGKLTRPIPQARARR